MNTIGFYDFNITTGSAIQAEALFDIFDELASANNGERPLNINPLNSSNRVERKNKKKGYP